MKLRKTILLSLLAILCIASLSCNSQKKVQRRGGYLLVKNTVRTGNAYIPADELEGLVQQKATSGRLSLLKPGVWIYETFSGGKEHSFKQKFREKYGTPPVILDSGLFARSEKDMLQYLGNKGFHQARVEHKAIYRKSTVRTEYLITAGSPSVISQVNYQLPDSILASYFFADTAGSLVKKGMIFDTYLLDEERDRITQYLRNQGYYNFSKANINYKADTLAGPSKVKLTLRIRPLDVLTDSTAGLSIPRYFIRDIYIMPDVEQALLSGYSFDTLDFRFRNSSRDTSWQVIHLLYGKKSRLKPTVFANAITLRTGQPYRAETVTQTYKRLIAMPVVRSATVKLIPAEQSQQDSLKRALDCSVRLTRNPVNNLSVGTEGTNSAGSLGMGFNVLFQNRNIFRGAETFRLKMNTGAELQGTISGPGNERKLWVFNALEAGIETGIDFPRLLVPFAFLRNERSQVARTSLSAGAGFESRPDYSRRITTFSGSYQWSSAGEFRHIFSPLELNFVRIDKDSAFRAYLTSLSDPQFISQYNDHLLTMVRYSLIWSNQARLRQDKPFYFRVNAETSGNVFYGLDNISNRRLTSDGYYERFGVRYAQYLRSDLDYRQFWNIRTGYMVAYRLMAGIGVPYGNSDGIPFEKSFWLGGANDMRGWRLRSLGPGEYSNDSVRYDRTGDLMAFTSLEYRFPVYSFLNGALFADAGNIWLRKANPDFPGGNFRLSRLGQQLAIDAGLGLRFDFSFFIFRIDWALRMKNPQQEAQWFRPDDFRIRSAIWNFGIGYPF